VFRSAPERAGLQLEVDFQVTKEITSVDRDMWENIVLKAQLEAFKFTFETVSRVGQLSVLSLGPVAPILHHAASDWVADCIFSVVSLASRSPRSRNRRKG